MVGCASRRRLLFSVLPPTGHCCCYRRCRREKILANKPKLMGPKRPLRPRGVEELVSYWAWFVFGCRYSIYLVLECSPRSEGGPPIILMILQKNWHKMCFFFRNGAKPQSPRTIRVFIQYRKEATATPRQITSGPRLERVNCQQVPPKNLKVESRLPPRRRSLKDGTRCAQCNEIQMRRQDTPQIS